MRTVELTTKEFETIPGYTTKLTPAVWRGKIDGLLYRLEELPNVVIEKQAWIKEKGIQMQTLLLELTITVGNVERTIQFQMKPVLIRRKRRVGGRYGKIKLVDEMNTSWKLFHDLLQSKLAAARLGMVEIHHEFMPYIAKQLPDDSIGTFADFMDVAMQRPEGLEGLQLEHIPEVKVVDVDYEVKEEKEA